MRIQQNATDKALHYVDLCSKGTSSARASLRKRYYEAEVWKIKLSVCVCVCTCGYLTFTAYASFINNSQLQVHEDRNSSLIGSNAGEDFGGLKGRRGGSRKVKWSTEEDWRLLAFLDFSIKIERLASSLGVPPSNTRQA